MWAIVKRAVPPIVLMLAGGGLLLYGMRYHRVDVVETKTVTEKVQLPPPPMPGLWPGEPPGEGGPFGQSQPAPEEESPFEKPAAGGEEESPFETPAAKEEKSSPGKAPAETSEEERSLMERFSLTDDSGSEESLSGGLPFGGPGPFGPPGPFGAPPQFVEQTYTETIIHHEPEPVVVREVTFGGLARLDNGQLKRTYSGKPPSLCPT